MDFSDATIIGGGASGITAALALARRGRSVTLLEKMPCIGKKVIASGNGRCNLLNDRLADSFYNQEAKNLVGRILSRFGKDRIIKLFEDANVRIRKEDDGRIFPATYQSHTVVKALGIELGRLNVNVILNCTVTSIEKVKGAFAIKTRTGKGLLSGKIVLACGGKSYPALGSDGSGYALASSLGHTIIEPVPSAVPLIAKSKICHKLQGQKIRGCVRLIERGAVTEEACGDILFTNYGLSGTAILDISERVSILINRKKAKGVTIAVDPISELDVDRLSSIVSERSGRGYRKEDILVGILPNKLSVGLKDMIDDGDYFASSQRLKDIRFDIIGTRGWNEAEFTAGGVDTSEVSDNLESKKTKGIFFCGEVLNVTGKRGGYNLAWAWASGHVAGDNA